MNFENAVALLIQIPLAGVVVYVVERFLKFLEESDKRNKEFINQLTADHNAAQGRIAEEVKILAQMIGQLQGEIIEHNALTQQAINQMQTRVNNGKTRA